MTELPKIFVKSVRTSGGQEINFSAEEKVLIVGPNNAGKSQFLKEIYKTIECHPQHSASLGRVVLSNIETENTADVSRLEKYLVENAESVAGQYRLHGVQFPSAQSTLRSFYGESPCYGSLGPLFCRLTGAEQRLEITKVKQGVGADGFQSLPQHLMYDGAKLTARISKLFKKAFSKELFFNYRANPDIPLHVGAAPDQNKYPNQVSDEYVEKVKQSPRLDKQGDGMRGYAGILFEVIGMPRPITLLDEPEAFLHPPQMRKLGQTLAEESTGQIFVSTHSSDILRGFLASTDGDVRIIRLQRNGASNEATETSPKIIKELWERPELRYSNALDGIFHEQVVICEDDSDCRLYNAVVDHLEKENPSEPWPDTAYVPSGGKHAIPKIASALNQLGVKVKVAADLDVLSEKDLFKNLVESLGGIWDEISPNWKQLDDAVRDGVKPKSVDEIKKAIINTLNKSDEESLPKSDVKDLMKQGNSWSRIKKYGKQGFPNGQAQTVFETLNTQLNSIGIYLVPVGELENFCPDIGSHGPKHVSNLLQSEKLGDKKLKGLRDFVALLR